ncbi:type II secretion system (T2SS) protein F [Kineococcus xinjiangensis]|uniref:Type II secretion system (T2SS) protein F n=1 Tax=Kineococcus xinjiangensis TaxID=512762 RepID=A0A2S6IFK5_9ACTN|nr:type II secretion system F family protein [Kineococcus xinjiangensis]PPK92930.1 type II secretion system (T2SS) protein F [Kineococcus xinjiangensis]
MSGTGLLVGLLAAAVVLLLPARAGEQRLGPPPRPPGQGAAGPGRRVGRSLLTRGARTARRGAGGDPDPEPDLPLLLDLVAAATRSGCPPGAALDAVLDVLPAACTADLRRVRAQLSLGAPPESAWADVPAPLHRLRDPLLLSAATGAPAAALLEAAATEARRDGRRAAEVAAARLGALLVLPLGACTLPAFVLLGVVPVLLSLSADVLTGP